MTDVRVLKFDAQAVEALAALGFTIPDDGQSARIGGEIEITVVRPADMAELEFRFEIRLPSGATLTCCARRRALLDASNDDAVRASLEGVRPAHATDSDESVAADRLRGAIEIGAEIDEPPHRVYYLWSQGRLPGVYTPRSARFAALTTLVHAPENKRELTDQNEGST